MKRSIFSAIIVIMFALPLTAQNITRVDENGNTLYFGLKSNKTASKYDKTKTPPSYEVIAPLTPAVGKSETVKNAIDTAWVPFVYETIQKYNNTIAGIVTVPKRITYNGVNYPVTQIGKQAFKDCKKITKIALPLSVTEIDIDAFNGCTELAEILLPPNMQKIGSCAFDKCKKLKTIQLYCETPPEFASHTDFYLFGVTLIVPPKTADLYYSTEPWSDAKKIIEREPDATSMPSFWVTAETGQKFLGQVVSNDEATSTVVSYAALTPYIKSEESYDDVNGELKIPWSVTKDGNSLKVISISENAFNECGLTSVRIPSSVETIKKAAFKNCKKLTYVRIDGNKVEIADDAFEGIPEDAILSVPKLSGSYYKQLPACKKFKEIKEALAK